MMMLANNAMTVAARTWVAACRVLCRIVPARPSVRCLLASEREQSRRLADMLRAAESEREEVRRQRDRYVARCSELAARCSELEAAIQSARESESESRHRLALAVAVEPTVPPVAASAPGSPIVAVLVERFGDRGCCRVAARKENGRRVYFAHYTRRAVRESANFIAAALGVPVLDAAE